MSYGSLRGTSERSAENVTNEFYGSKGYGNCVFCGILMKTPFHNFSYLRVKPLDMAKPVILAIFVHFHDYSVIIHLGLIDSFHLLWHHISFYLVQNDSKLTASRSCPSTRRTLPAASRFSRFLFDISEKWPIYLKRHRRRNNSSIPKFQTANKTAMCWEYVHKNSVKNI